MLPFEIIFSLIIILWIHSDCCVSIFYPFLLLSSIPRWIWIYRGFFNHLKVEGHFGFFQFRLWWINVTWFLYQKTLRLSTVISGLGSMYSRESINFLHYKFAILWWPDFHFFQFWSEVNMFKILKINDMTSCSISLYKPANMLCASYFCNQVKASPAYD